MAASSIAFCAGNEELDETRKSYLQAQLAWAGLQPLLIGPMGEGNRAWQVQFWPDKKNLVGRQVAALMKKKPQLTQADLENGSVVLQGLTAYEYLLYDKAIDLTDSATKARYCPLLQAIGEHQQKLSADILAQWEAKDGMATQLREFPNERYVEPTEAIADLLRVQVTALDGVKKKLGAPLGRQSKGHPQPFQAEAWRSEATLASTDAALAGARRAPELADLLIRYTMGEVSYIAARRHVLLRSPGLAVRLFLDAHRRRFESRRHSRSQPDARPDGAPGLQSDRLVAVSAESVPIAGARRPDRKARRASLLGISER